MLLFKSFIYVDFIFVNVCSVNIIFSFCKNLKHSLDDLPILNISIAFSNIFFFCKFFVILSFTSIKLLFDDELVSSILLLIIFKVVVLFVEGLLFPIYSLSSGKLLLLLLYKLLLFSKINLFFDFFSFFSTKAFKLNTNLFKKFNVFSTS